MTYTPNAGACFYGLIVLAVMSSHAPGQDTAHSPGDIVFGGRVVDCSGTKDGVRPAGVRISKLFVAGNLSAAGLHQGDIILSVNGTHATAALLLETATAHISEDIEVRYSRFRDGTWDSSQVVLQNKPTEDATTADIAAFEATRIRDAERKIWDLGTGLKGTPDQIGAQLNSGVEEAWRRYISAKSDLEAKTAEIDTEEAADLRLVHDSAEYRRVSTEQKTAAAAADAARSSGDHAAALAQGSIANVAKRALSNMEAKEVSGDQNLSADKEKLPALQDRVQQKTASLLKATEWRSRVIQSMRTGWNVDWPIKIGSETFVAGGKVLSVSESSVSIAAEACERGEVIARNGGGDGIDLVSYIPHEIALSVPLPVGEKPMPGSLLRLARVYKIAGRGGVVDEAPIFDCLPDDDGNLSVLFAAINDLHGPGPKYLEAVDIEVSAAIDKECRRQ
jgi:hypothetical protein